MNAEKLYDQIKDEYQSSKRLPFRMIEQIQFLQLLGDIKDQVILELACGEGFYSRQFIDRGAKFVIALDISGQMIDLAKSQQKTQEYKDRIIFLHHDASQLYSDQIQDQINQLLKERNLNQFDIVCAAFLLNYAKNINQFDEFIKSISSVMQKNCRFVSVNDNPFDDVEQYNLNHHKNLGLIKKLEDSNLENETVSYTFLNSDGSKCTIFNYRLNKESMNQCFKNSNLLINWIPFEISTQFNQLPNDLLKFFDCCPFILLQATKI